jgi:undecaprenyl-diphosphatase
LIVESNFTSFPSGHSTFAFALAFSIFLYDKKYGSIFLIMAFLVSLGRIFTGVHFPFDIFIGAIIGVTTSGIF